MINNSRQRGLDDLQPFRLYLKIIPQRFCETAGDILAFRIEITDDKHDQLFPSPKKLLMSGMIANCDALFSLSSNLLALVCPAPDLHRLLALKDHVIRKNARQPYFGSRFVGTDQQQA